MASILDSFPAYASTSHLDRLRETEYGYLDDQNHVYLDYTGSGLAASAQHRVHAARQQALVLGNPHSVSPTSALATDLVEQTRVRVLQHLNADPAEYAVVFTPNATGAARLIGEAYVWDTQPKHRGIHRRRTQQQKQKLVLTADNHNSLNGLREYARRAGVSAAYVPSRHPDMHIDEDTLLRALGPELVPSEAPTTQPVSASSDLQGSSWKAAALRAVSCGLFADSYNDKATAMAHAETGIQTEKPAPHQGMLALPGPLVTKRANHDHAHHRGLFAYPAQSNFSGVRHPLAWVSAAQARGYDVLLDAAAYLPTGMLDLGVHHPDFVLISWYKLFGYPTGVGCLVARREALGRLARPWFSGGTIRAVSVGLDWHAPAHRLEAQFEDGTVNFQAIPDVQVGLDWLTGREVGGMAAVQTRVRCLTGWFLQRLLAMRHMGSPGTPPMVVLYGPDHCAADGANRGGTVTFNFVDPAGAVIDERIVAAEAAAARISLRTGCFCNPGAGEIALGFSLGELRTLQRLAANSIPPTDGHGSTQSASTDTDVESESGWASRWASRAGRRSSTDGSTVADTSPPPTAVSQATTMTASTTETKTSKTKSDEAWPIAGAVRVSFGVASNTDDVERFFAFAVRFQDRLADNRFLGPRVEC